MGIIAPFLTSRRQSVEGMIEQTNKKENL